MTPQHVATALVSWLRLSADPSLSAGHRWPLLSGDGGELIEGSLEIVDDLGGDAVRIGQPHTRTTRGHNLDMQDAPAERRASLDRASGRTQITPTGRLWWLPTGGREAWRRGYPARVRLGAARATEGPARHPPAHKS